MWGKRHHISRTEVCRYVKENSKLLGTIILIFFIPLSICLGTIGHALSPSWEPVEDVSAYASFSDNFARLNLQVISEDQSLNSFTVGYEICYYVVPELTMPTRFTMITTGPEPTAGIGVSFGIEHHIGLSYFFLENGTYLVYDTWAYSGTMTVYVSSRQPELFPYDIYTSQRFYVWFNSTIYPRISLESAPPAGFDMSLVVHNPMSRDMVWNEMSLGQRLFVGLPEVDPLMFQLSIYRDQSQRLYFATFSYAIDLFVLWLPFLAWSSGMRIPDRIKVIAGMSISVFAFLWTLTTVVKSVTYVQLFATLMLLAWSGFEVLLHIRKRTGVGPPMSAAS